MVIKKNEHPMDMIKIKVLLSDKLIGSSENTSIIPKGSKEDALVEASHIDFNFGDQ